MARLTPADPMAYFLLAEEVADEGAPSNIDLARQLYVLSYELDQRQEPSKRSAWLGSSVCLGLAALTQREEEVRWLSALATIIVDGSQASEWTRSQTPTTPRQHSVTPAEVALEFAAALGYARAGEGRRAEPILEKPAIADLLTKLDAVPVTDPRLSSLSSFVRRAVRDWPSCPQCRGRRAVSAGTPGKPTDMALCDTCLGNPGPKIAPAEQARQLRVEAVLLNGSQRSWGAQVVADGGAPLRDLDSSELAATYRIDPLRPLWRNGGWTADRP